MMFLLPSAISVKPGDDAEVTLLKNTINQMIEMVGELKKASITQVYGGSLHPGPNGTILVLPEMIEAGGGDGEGDSVAAVSVLGEIDPDPHGHTINHGHTLSGTATATDAGHTHTGTTDSHVHTLNLHTHAIANIPVYTGQNGTGCLLGYANGTSATPYPLNTEGNTATFTTASGEAVVSVNISGVSVDDFVGVSGEEELSII